MTDRAWWHYPPATDTFTASGTWWCNSHGRAATHLMPDGKHCCAPGLGGILLPCFAVFAPMTVELEGTKT